MHQPRANRHAEAQQKQQNLKIPFITPPRFGAGLLGLSLVDSFPPRPGPWAPSIANELFYRATNASSLMWIELLICSLYNSLAYLARMPHLYRVSVRFFTTNVEAFLACFGVRAGEMRSTGGLERADGAGDHRAVRCLFGKEWPARSNQSRSFSQVHGKFSCFCVSLRHLSACRSQGISKWNGLSEHAWSNWTVHHEAIISEFLNLRPIL